MTQPVKHDPTAITHHDGGTTLTGDAITLYRWGVIRAALKLYINTGMMLTRGATITLLLRQTAEITKPKKPYKVRNKADWQRAHDDIDRSCKELRAAIPDVDERTK